MGFGKPKYGNTGETFKKRNVWSLKESDSVNIYRIFGPMHSLAESGKWAQYCIVHWGFSGLNSSDPSKTVMRPFNCVEVTDRFRNLVTECPQCTKYDQIKSETEATEATMKAAGKSKEEIESVLGSAKGYLKAFAPDKKFYLNVMNQAGEFGFLKIGYKAKKLLDAKIQELREKKNVDPLDLDGGVWFNFKRSGTGRETQDVVDVVTEPVEVNGETFERLKKAPISEELANRALAECDDLVNCGGFKLTVEQVQLLVDCSGDPEEVDAIVGVTQRVATPEPSNHPKVQKTQVEAKVSETNAVEEAKPEVKSEAPKSKIGNEDFLKKFGKKTKAA